jgi:hypothetical protein
MSIGCAANRLSVRFGPLASTGPGGRLAVIPCPGEMSGLAPICRLISCVWLVPGAEDPGFETPMGAARTIPAIASFPTPVFVGKTLWENRITRTPTLTSAEFRKCGAADISPGRPKMSSAPIHLGYAMNWLSVRVGRPTSTRAGGCLGVIPRPDGISRLAIRY